MFYTKYRPQKFSEISKPNIAAEALSKQIKNNATSHAYLFIGSRGTGKTSTARILAKSLNCTNETSLKLGDPCDECSNCLSVKNQSFSDLIEIDGASNRGIEDIRELQAKINLSPIQGSHKVYIIDEVHMLTMPAFNALLKTLEEPPKKVTFILCTTEPNKIPDTIKSRCQTFLFKRATNEQLKTKLKLIAQNENYNLSEDTLNTIVNSSLGGFRDAETLLQQVIEGDLENIDSSFVNDYSSVLLFIDYLYNKESDKAITLVNDLYIKGVDLKNWLSEVILFIRAVILYQSASEVVSMQLSPEIIGKIQTKYSKLNLIWYVKIVSLLLKTVNQIEASFIPQLPLELSIITVCDISGKTSTNSKKKVPSEKLNNDYTPKELENNEISETLNDLENNVDTNISAQENNPLKDASSINKINKTTTKEVNKSNKEVNEPKNKENNIKHSTIEQVLNSSNTLQNKKEQINDTPNKEENNSDSQESKNTNTTEVSDITLEDVTKNWKAISEKVKKLNTALVSILKSSNPVDVKNNKIVLDVYYAFHKERLETAKNKNIIDTVLTDIFNNSKITFICNINPKKPKKLKEREVGVLTDANVVAVETQDLMKMFDGGLA